MDLSNKIVLAHKGFYSKASEKLYSENSKEVCTVSGAKKYVSIIELDVRKSKDGFLYCYHGNYFYYYISSKVPLNLKDIQARYNVNTLQEVLSVIPQDKTIFLDFKDTSITREDILKTFDGIKFKEVILGNKSTTFLNKFHDMPKEFVKILNGDAFCTFRNLKKLKSNNYKYFEVVFPLQVRTSIIKKVEGAGLEFRSSCVFFRNKKRYLKLMKKYDIKHISSDFI